MARDSINVLKPVYDNSESVATVKCTKQAVTQANGIEISKAFENKDNTLFIMIENTTTVSNAAADSSATIKAGNAYPNSMLGDLSVTLEKSAITAIQIQDPSRFENADGSICIDFASGFTGNIFAVAKRVGLKPIA